MSLENVPDIPDEIESMMESGEVGNMRNLCGWAVGTIVERRIDGRDLIEIEHGEAWVELFNGDGRAGEFGGVRYMAVWDGEYDEAYAYPSEESARGNEPCYYVSEWTVPDQPDVGMKYPNTPGVVK